MTERQLEQLPKQAMGAAREAANNPWVERLARLGYAVRGLVYGLVGVLAAQAAFGMGGKTTDTTGALATLEVQPFGQFILYVVALGLFGYGLGRILDGALDFEHKGTDAKGIGTRLGYVGQGLVSIGLAATALRIALIAKTSDGGAATEQSLTASLLQKPFGVALVCIIGAAVLGVAGYALYQAYSARFMKHMKQNDEWIKRLGQFGYAARGVVFAIIGLFIIQAALAYDPQKVVGLGGALAAVAQRPFGQILLGVVALGLIAYGLFMFVQARYRRVLGQ